MGTSTGHPSSSVVHNRKNNTNPPRHQDTRELWVSGRLDFGELLTTGEEVRKVIGGGCMIEQFRLAEELIEN
jgi:hypothetical protein